MARHHDRVSVSPIHFYYNNGGDADITDIDMARYFETLDLYVQHEPILDGPGRKQDVADARPLVWSTTD